MITFIGEYEAKLDDKGRVVFPSAFRSIMPEDGDMRFIIKKNVFAKCLEMFTFDEWSRQAEQVKSSLNTNFLARDDAFWREYTKHSAIVVPDGKLGRLSIPAKLMEIIGVNKEIVFSGNDYKIEIWAKEEYEQSNMSQEEYLRIAAELSQKR